MTHCLKIEKQWYDLIEMGEKCFEIRKDDRNPKYKSGDILCLQAITDTGKYTGDEIFVRVDCVYRGNLCKDGYCVMGIHKVWLNEL